MVSKSNGTAALPGELSEQGPAPEPWPWVLILPRCARRKPLVGPWPWVALQLMHLSLHTHGWRLRCTLGPRSVAWLIRGVPLVCRGRVPPAALPSQPGPRCKTSGEVLVCLWCPLVAPLQLSHRSLQSKVKHSAKDKAALVCSFTLESAQATTAAGAAPGALASQPPCSKLEMLLGSFLLCGPQAGEGKRRKSGPSVTSHSEAELVAGGRTPGFGRKEVALHRCCWAQSEGHGRWLAAGGASGVVLCAFVPEYAFAFAAGE